MKKKWIAALVLVACGTDAASATVLRPQTVPVLPTVVERMGEIVLQEDTAVINVSPSVTIGPGGSFVIADAREHRIRRYDRDGKLLFQFGARGQGPGEFGLPTHALMQDSTIFVADFSGRFFEFDSVGSSVLRDVRPPVGPLYTGRPLAGGSILLAGLGRADEDPRPLLHLWDTTTGTLTRSFFPTPGDLLTRRAAVNFGSATFDVRGDTIATVASFSDTLYFFTLNGEEAGKLPLPFGSFRRITEFPEGDRPPDEFSAWLDELHLLTHIYWLEDGLFLIQYERPRGRDREWNLLGVTRTGERVFEAVNSPRLLAVNGDLWYFVDAASRTPNRWIVTRYQTKTT